MKKRFLFVEAILALLCLACVKDSDERLSDGYFTAEIADYEHGWKEYVSVYTSNNTIVTVEYNAKNESGFIKSWDMDYMRRMNAVDGTYPNKYTRSYSTALINRQDPAKVDAITGASDSYASFRLLAEAAIAQAKKGDKRVALVKAPKSAGSAE